MPMASFGDLFEFDMHSDWWHWREFLANLDTLILVKIEKLVEDKLDCLYQ